MNPRLTELQAQEIWPTKDCKLGDKVKTVSIKAWDYENHKPLSEDEIEYSLDTGAVVRIDGSCVHVRYDNGGYAFLCPK